jgi:anti-sigma regulatory factor (Ser/Thr protein kinase)
MRTGEPLGNVGLPNRAESVMLARQFVELVARAYDIEHVAETAALLVSELATNVTRHARDADNPLFHVAVSRIGERMRVEVHDSSSRLPSLRRASALDEDGRGLCIVKELAHDHGVHPLPQGKSTWYELIAWRYGGIESHKMPASHPGRPNEKAT